MSPLDAVIAVLLVAGCLLLLASCVALALVDGVYDRLHYLGPGTLGVVLVVTAATLDQGLSAAGTKVLLSGLALAACGPVLTHATGRAALIREHGKWEVRTDGTDDETEGSE